MGLNDTPSGERVHIGFFGCRNAGKSSLVNAVTGQELSVVSDILGTTTDPVKKTMELLPLGPVVIIDTPGFDDSGSLGELRVKKTRQILGQTDIAVLVTDALRAPNACENELISLFNELSIPFVIAYNKCDLLGNNVPDTFSAVPKERKICVSALKGQNIYELKELIAGLIKPDKNEVFLCGDLIKPGDIVLLVIPIDKAAPKGRLILPEQMVIRDVLDNDAIPVCIKEDRLAEFLEKPGFKPSIVITDSQVFGPVSKIVPEDIPLTSFSILMARHKGLLKEAVRGAAALKAMHDKTVMPKDHTEPNASKPYRILISEGCTHHRQCDDIGTVKIPRWLGEYIGGPLDVSFSSGQQFPEDVSGYDLIIHCGGCMLNEKEVLTRMKRAVAQGTAITNYGIAIAQFKGILKRSTTMLPEVNDLL